jgi:acyl-[acyl-carrier-protein]-phospholipid O-acyltransferase/long-chain-fatty-acid--[acyl-carrier-protein] ligase
VDDLSTQAEITWLDDVRRSLGPLDKAYAALAGLLPRRFRARAAPDDPGVILFTSGSFGAPRGVVLTQANMLANVEQVAAHIELDPDWVFFNPLPMFHALGLISTTLPLLRGMRGFLYPSPLHFKQIPGLIRETGAAVLFGTDTFVNQYARAAEPGDLAGLTFVVCGAEKVRPETQRMFPGVPVLEGYGATECAPVISVNQPQDNRLGSVGRLLPGVEARLEPVEGVSEGGRLYVRGPNVMAGYLGEEPDMIEPLSGGWHDTGDVVSIDAEGLVRILGRVKRFAKIGGEMVSLSAVEDLVGRLWPDSRHACVSLPDPRKGERLVLVTDRTEADVGAIAAFAREHGAPEIAVPKKIVRVEQVPVLGSGKTDYVTIQRVAEAESG